METPRTRTSETSGSGAIENKCLFDPLLYEETERDKEMSLQLLANCVLIVNNTILRERKMVPADYFVTFPVYGDVLGYLINPKCSEAKELDLKLAAMHTAIRNRCVHKLAIVVEEELHMGPVETFIWHFKYHDSLGADAEIGYNGKKSKFRVRYSNMDATQQEFCRLFRDLQQIFKELGPLPTGLVPSLKVAYRGEPELPRGFHQVDEFVNVDHFQVGAVEFPHGNGFHLTYASNFIADHNQNQKQADKNREMILDNPPHSPQSIQHQDSYRHPSSPGSIEVTRGNRRPTMEIAEDSLIGSPASVPENQEVVIEDNHVDDELMNLSMSCHPNIVSQAKEQQVPQSAFNKIPSSEPMEVEVSELPVKAREKTPEESLRKRSGRVSAGSKAQESIPRRKASPKRKTPPMKKSTEKKSKKSEEKKKQEKSEPLKKKCARRLTVDRVSEPEPEEEPEPVAQVQKQISEGPVQVAEIVLAETHEELAEPQVGREEEPEDDEVQPMEIEEPAEPPSREFGVSKTFNQESPDVTALEPEQDAQQDPTRIYGRVSSILSLQASGEVVDDLDESALSLPPPPPPATETKQIYGRVSGLRESQELVETPKAPVPPARFGRVAALRNIDHAASRRQI